MANQVIVSKKLKEEDCIFLWARNQYHDTSIKNCDLPYVHLPKESFFVSINFFKNWRLLDEMDHWFTQLTEGKTFVFYLPQMGANLYQLIVSHVLCKGFYYLEEGRGSYLKPDQLLSSKKPFFLRDWWYQLNFKNRSKSVKHFYDIDHPKYLGAIGISTDSFPDLPNREAVGLPFYPVELEQNIDHLLVLQPLVENNEVNLAELLGALKDFLDWLKQRKITEVYYKFHPSQRKEVSIQPILSLFEASPNTKFLLLESKHSLEEIAASSDTKYYMFTSSVGLYAILCNSEVYSLNDLLTKRNPDFQSFVDGMPMLQREKMLNIVDI